MIRENKFRAWDKDENKMIDWQELIDYCDIDYLFGNVGLNPKRDTVPDFEVMQYAGLKDDNDIEIYEGTVIGKEGYPSYYVLFELGSYVVVSTNKVQALNWNYWRLDEMLNMGFISKGNIYENPELLEKR